MMETIWAVGEPGQHLALQAKRIIEASGGIAHAGPAVAVALKKLIVTSPHARVLICGRLYLAGKVLKQDRWQPS